ncbi:PhzF family phenazine biosynthesis protein [Cytophagaceae bacterium DM2B3-1]|uniref:PhzF family phenazine biosynthesis protein n=1 Tax=Xanthocytophaga flava TaxID=3048013 RepID=A0ABT7CM94_9BACT|nr:PhzF family phenazine biosynthesis protein [Xanthocytophaga flavus]MDJ1493779.1 PhzF family phenazine biosynthesis protein [Xanthocytophaga flavus]
MQVEVHIVNAFTQQGKGGNPAAIVLDADNLSISHKQEIAAKAGLSETAFVSSSTIADIRLEFFTPTRQIAHCGHATIATFAYLKHQGTFTQATQATKETIAIDGIRQIRFLQDTVYMEQKAPHYTFPEASDLPIIYRSLGLSQYYTLKPALVNTGNTFLILEVSEVAVLQHITPNFERIAAISEKYNLVGYYVFAKSQQPGIDATTRMFAPLYGIEEESATGMAAGPLAAFLYQSGSRKEEYTIEQGRYMKQPSPSLIHINLEIQDGQIELLYVGGQATLAEKYTIEI